MANYIDYLSEDDVIENQLFYCVSFIPADKAKSALNGAVKVRGVFSTLEATQKFAKEMSKKHDKFDTLVGSVGKWVPFNPDPEQIEDEEYREKELNKLVKGYKDGREKATEQFEERKETMMKETAVEEEKKLKKQRQKLKKRNRKKAASNPNIIDVESDEEKVSTLKKAEKVEKVDKDVDDILMRIEEREKELQLEHDNLNNDMKEILVDDSDLKELDSMIEKINN
jgi:hypothetical protein